MELPSPRADLFSCPSLRRTRRDNAWSPRPRSGRKPNGRAAEPPPEPSPGHVPRCERAISPTYAAKPGLTCTAACRFLCRTASDQARRASGRWPKGASEPPASFRGAGRPELCQSRFNSERQPMCCKNAGLAVPARSGDAFRGGDKARTGITPRRSSGRSVGRDRRPPKTAKPTFLQHIVWRSRAAGHCRAVGRAAWTRIDSHDNQGRHSLPIPRLDASETPDGEKSIRLSFDKINPRIAMGSHLRPR